MMREGSELEPTSPTTALTTTRKLDHVTGTENLPPSVAREVAEIVATYQVTRADLLRHDVPKLWPIALIFVLPFICIGVPKAALPLAGLLPLALTRLRQKAPLSRAQQHLKELGIGWRARRRLGTKLAAIVGSTPAQDPAKRPGVDEIVAFLAPGGQDPWAPSTSMAAPAVLTPSARDATLAHSVVSHAFEGRLREYGLYGFFGALGVCMGAMRIVFGSPSPSVALVVLLTSVLFVGLSLGALRIMSRRVLGRMLASLGVVPAEQERIVAALKPLLSRASLAAIPAYRRQEVLSKRLVEALAATAPSALPASSSEPSSS
jgi:hypothetical protein